MILLFTTINTVKSNLHHLIQIFVNIELLRSPIVMCVPDGTGEVNWEGVKYYNKLIDALLARGMNSFYILHHGPIYLYH